MHHEEVDNQKIIGIDLINIDMDGGVYGIYESNNSGKNWHIVTKSKTIESLVNFMKLKYNPSVPLIMTDQMQEILRYEFISERERIYNKISPQEKISLLQRCVRKLTTFFKRSMTNGKKMWRRSKSDN